jgi:predicted O-methyltransferase YrrM
LKKGSLGFDLFEEASDETDEVEKNVKAHNNQEEVAERLNAAGVSYRLYGGNTRETLPAYTGPLVDLAFIDGGHSVETIQSDWNEVRHLMKPGGIVIFDDYYEGMPEEDLDKWGANRVLEEAYATLKYDYTLSESRDPVVGGGVTRLAWVEV